MRASINDQAPSLIQLLRRHGVLAQVDKSSLDLVRLDAVSAPYLKTFHQQIMGFYPNNSLNSQSLYISFFREAKLQTNFFCSAFARLPGIIQFISVLLYNLFITLQEDFVGAHNFLPP